MDVRLIGGGRVMACAALLCSALVIGGWAAPAVAQTTWVTPPKPAAKAPAKRTGAPKKTPPAARPARGATPPPAAPPRPSDLLRDSGSRVERELQAVALCRAPVAAFLSQFRPDYRGPLFDTYIAPPGANIGGAQITSISYSFVRFDSGDVRHLYKVFFRATPEQHARLASLAPFVSKSSPEVFALAEQDLAIEDTLRRTYLRLANPVQRWTATEATGRDRVGRRWELSAILRDSGHLTQITCNEDELLRPKPLPVAKLAAPTPRPGTVDFDFARDIWPFPAGPDWRCPPLYRDKPGVVAFDAATREERWGDVVAQLRTTRCHTDLAYLWLGRAAEAQGANDLAFGYYQQALAIAGSNILTQGVAGRCMASNGARCRGLEVTKEANVALDRVMSARRPLGPYPPRAAVTVDQFLALNQARQQQIQTGSASGGLSPASAPAPVPAYAAAPPPPPQMAIQVVTATGRGRYLVEPGGGCGEETMLLKGYCFDEPIARLRADPKKKDVTVIRVRRNYALGARIGNGEYDYVEVKRRDDGTFKADKDLVGAYDIRPPRGCDVAGTQNGGFIISTVDGRRGAVEVIDYLCRVPAAQVAAAQAPAPAPAPAVPAAEPAGPAVQVITATGRARYLVEPSRRCGPETMLLNGYCFDEPIEQLKRDPRKKDITAIRVRRPVEVGARIGNGEYDYVEVKRRDDGTFKADKDNLGTTQVSVPRGCNLQGRRDEGFIIEIVGGRKAAVEFVDYLCLPYAGR